MAFPSDENEFLPHDPRRPIPAGDDFMELFGTSGSVEFEPVIDDDEPEKPVDLRAAREAIESDSPPAKGDRETRPPARTPRTKDQQPGGKPSDRTRAQGPTRKPPGAPAKSAAPPVSKTPAAESSRTDVTSGRTGAEKSARFARQKNQERPSAAAKSSPSASADPRPDLPAAPNQEKKTMSNWERLAALLGLRSASTEPDESRAQAEAKSPDRPSAADSTPHFADVGDQNEPEPASILNELFVPSGEIFAGDETPRPVVDDVQGFDADELGDVNQELMVAEEGDDSYVEFALEELDPHARESGGFGRDEADLAEDDFSESGQRPRRRRRRGRRGRGRPENQIENAGERTGSQTTAESESDELAADGEADLEKNRSTSARRPRPERSANRTESRDGDRENERRENTPRTGKRRDNDRRDNDRRDHERRDGGRAVDRDTERRDRSQRNNPPKSPPVDLGDDDFVEFGEDVADSTTDKKITTWTEVIGAIVDTNLKTRRPGRSGGPRHRPRDQRNESRGDNRGEGRGGDRGEGRGDRGEGRGDRGEGRGDRGEGRGDRGEGREDRGEGRGDRGEGRDAAPRR